MTRMLLAYAVVVLLVIGCLLVPLEANALPKGKVGYKAYHYEDDSWVRYSQGDPFPPGGANPGTNLWKYEYVAYNHEFWTPEQPADVYQMWMFFNPDSTTERAVYSSETGPDGWITRYFGPSAPYVNWKVRFRTSSSTIAPGDSLSGYEIEFTWTDPAMLPGPQPYDLICAAGSETGVTHELPPDVTPVEATTWGRIKTLFSK